MLVAVRELLKSETFSEHLKSEKILAPKLSTIRNYDDYAAILKMFYGYFHPLEKKITHYLGEEVLTDMRERRNSLFILTDLKAIKHSTEQLPVCNKLPQMNSSAEALGALYVLEGSTLGGRMISRMLMKNTAVALNDSNLNFFNGYKEHTGSKWSYFLSVIDNHQDDADVIVAAARETFNCLTKWMEQSL